MSYKNLLQNVYLFKTFTDEQLNKVNEIAEEKIYGVGEDIFIQGSSAQSMYIIKLGSIKLSQSTNSGESITVTTLGTGSHFGELAFIDGENRFVSASCVERSELITLDYDKLKAILSEDIELRCEFYKEMAHFIVNRLRVTTQDLSFAREKNLTHL